MEDQEEESHEAEENEDYLNIKKYNCFCFVMKPGNEREMLPARILDYSKTIFNDVPRKDGMSGIVCKNSYILR